MSIFFFFFYQPVSPNYLLRCGGILYKLGPKTKCLEPSLVPTIISGKLFSVPPSKVITWEGVQISLWVKDFKCAQVLKEIGKC